MRGSGGEKKSPVSFRHLHNLSMVCMERGSSKVRSSDEVVSTIPRVKHLMVPIHQAL